MRVIREAPCVDTGCMYVASLSLDKFLVYFNNIYASYGLCCLLSCQTPAESIEKLLQS